MKWLIFLVLFSCGKNETPSLLDLEDRDGDQIIDHEEIGMDKYLADFQPLGLVSGKMKIFADTIIEAQLSNDEDLREKVLDVLVANPTLYKPDEYFSDWNRLAITQVPKTNIKADKYSVHLSFETNGQKPEGIELVSGRNSKDFGEWSAYMKISLKAEEIENLLTGKSYFKLKKKFIRSNYYRKDADQTIKEKSYRVYYYDGEKAKIIYASKLLPLEKLLDHLGIDQVYELNDDDLFFSSRVTSETKWYLKSFDNGDQALVKTPMIDAKNNFIKRFNVKTQYVTRTHGEPENAVSLSSNGKNKVYLRIRSSDRHLTKWGTSNYPGTGKCRRITMVKLWAEVVNLEMIIANLDFFVENQSIKQDIMKSSFLESGLDKRGLIWEMKIENALPLLSINIAPLPRSEFVQFKKSQPDCPGDSKKLYSPERAFFFEIESYVEKTE